MQLYNYRRKRRKGFHSSGYGSHRNPRKRVAGHHKRRRRGAWKRVSRILCVTGLLLVVVAAGGIGAFTYLRASGEKSLRQMAVYKEPDLSEYQDESGLVSRNGKKYTYNEDMINILFMGIDRDTDLTEAEEGASGENGQADTIFLLTLNQREKVMRLVGISRDTMTSIATYDYQGNYIGQTTNHLGLAFSFGDGRESSGELMTEAVSNLMYELPIHGYAAVNMNAIAKLNNAVGGVNVILPEDIILNGEAFESGTKLTLTGEQAYSFVRMRDTEKAGSNNLRMERQKQYALAFVNQAKQAIRKRATLAVNLYQDLTSDMVTNLDIDEAVYLASLLPGMSFRFEDICMVQGEVKQGNVYEEFYVDEDALLDLILELFYIEVD